MVDHTLPGRRGTIELADQPLQGDPGHLIRAGTHGGQTRLLLGTGTGVVETGHGHLLRDGDSGLLQSLQRPPGGRVVHGKDRIEPDPCGQRGRGHRAPLVKVPVRGPQQLRVDRQAGRGQRVQIPCGAMVTSLRGASTRPEQGDPTPAQGDQVAEGCGDRAAVVGADMGHCRPQSSIADQHRREQRMAQRLIGGGQGHR